MFCIYLLENVINGKKYIGQTSQSPNERWKNGNGYYNQGAIWDAIQKYGWENFTHTILEDNILTQKEANEKEQKYIKIYDCLAKNHKGYNISEGGSNGYPLAGKTPEELKIYAEKQRQISKQRFIDNPELKNKMSQISRTYWTEEKKKEKSNTLKEYYKNNQEARQRLINMGTKMIEDKKIPVICVETGQYFNSITEAGQWCNILGTSISLYLQGKGRYAGFHPKTKQRLHWCYPNEDLEKIKNKIYNIVCIETGDRFETAEEAAKVYHIDPSGLIKHLKHPDKYKSCGKHPVTKEKLHWIRNVEALNE